jgi:arylformamidase
MKLYDVTLPIREGMVTYPGDPPFEMQPYSRKRKGDPVNLSKISMGTHLGTHVDPPSHYLEGRATVDDLPVEVLLGPGVVLDMRGRSGIDREALDHAPLDDHIRVILKTDNGERLLENAFHDDYVHLTQDGARYLIDRGVQLVGIDYLSIERYQNLDAPVHHLLLDEGVIILEGLLLKGVPAGVCDVVCLPLRLKCGDGAPARVILRYD